MNTIVLGNINYNIVKSNHDLDIKEIEECYTDYYNEFDYIIGDYSYDKLRLKGYYDSKNSKVKPFNDIAGVDDYIRDYCSYGAKYFLLKRSK